MHELSLAQSIVDRITELSGQKAFSKVTRLRMEVGALSGVVSDSLQFCFSELARGTLLESAELVLNDVPLAVRCLKCSEQTCPEIYDIHCGKCGSNDVTVVAGRDFKIMDLEVE